MMVKYCILLLFICLILSDGKPARNRTKIASRKSAKIQTTSDAFKYLVKYGYSKCGDGQENITGEAPLCQSSIQSMTKHFQTVFRLPVTDKLDTPTLTLMNKARCGLEDHPMACFGSVPWPNTTLKWRLNNQIQKIGRDKTRALIQEAFDDWARYTPLKFREAIANEKAEFNISFHAGAHNDPHPFDGPGGTLAHAFFPKDGRIHFDSTEEWTDKYDGVGYNFRLVASHQIGHALGLPHSYDPKSLMYPFYQLFQPNELLPKDDRDGIRVLYGASSSRQPMIKTTTKKSETTASPSSSHERCTRYLDVVFGGGSDKWLYTLDHDLVWRFHPGTSHWDSQGVPISQAFPGAEPHMMAGILSPKTQKIYLFKGFRIWRFSSSKILDLGFPKRLSGTGAVYNPIAALYDKGYIWLLKGGLLFKFDEDRLSYEADKPPKRVDEQFPGVPYLVRTAFTHDGKHYFFTEPDRKVYVFDAKTRKVEPGYPKPMATGWFACKKKFKA